MTTRSRELREAVVRALARIGLVWAVTVLGALFVLTGLQAPALSGADGDPPSAAGLALTLVVLAVGVAVLAVGALRGGHEEPPAHDDRPVDLSMLGGLSLLP